MATPEEAWKVYQRADCLYSRPEVEAALDSMAAEITQRLSGCNPLVLCVMTGAVVAAGELLTRLEFPLELDYIHATRYGRRTAGGALEWIAHPKQPMAGRSVLVVDDILDEGETLASIIEHCRAEGANEVLSAVLVEKEHERKNGLEPDFVGLAVEDRYVFGYGMDYKGFLRNAPGIFAVAES
jgi:hypoxanthine phosphoribosyltransferase